MAGSIKAYTQAIKLHVDYAEAYYNRGVAYILSGDYASGIPDLSRQVRWAYIRLII